MKKAKKKYQNNNNNVIYMRVNLLIVKTYMYSKEKENNLSDKQD